MAEAQLKLVAKFEQDKEDQAAREFQTAQQFVNDHKQKLSGLEQYRIDYFTQIQEKGNEGLEAQSFNQHQGFIAKLDKACEQQRKVISNAELAAEQRREQWLAQQRKRKAVETLLQKKEQQQRIKEERIEQAQLDEFALQKFVRKAV